MATITKIQGWCSGENEYSPKSYIIREYQFKSPQERPAIMFISSDATPPSVMTLEEHREKVRAILQEVHNYNAAGRAIAMLVAFDHGIDLTT